MGIYLNTGTPLEAYQAIASTRFFVDKTWLIHDILESLELDNQRYICITRPRRFGKTVMANMLGAFFGKTADSRLLFDSLAIAQSDYYQKYRNTYDIFFIDFSRIPENCNTYLEYINRIIYGLKEDLAQIFPHIAMDLKKSIWDLLVNIFEKTKHQFIFIIDEWDAVFHLPFISPKEQQEYLLFLKNLLKDQPYVKFTYMTGILPIAKYSAGSEFNIFAEYNMATKEKFSRYFGFLNDEVDALFTVYQKTSKNPKITREDLRLWYDGYHTAAGDRLYNPRSVVNALSDNQLGSYWTGSGPYDEIFYYIQDNIDAIRDDFVWMISGEHVETKIQEYAATARALHTREQIYSAMVVYGLLTYEHQEVFIPNRELMEKYNELLLSNERMGYVSRLAKESAKMLKATLSGDTRRMAEILKFAHDTETPILSYNNETELSAVVNLVYLSARNKYRVEREDKAGVGYIDFIFYPEHPQDDAIILELKIDSTPDVAIQQIKNKNYALRFLGKLGEERKYKGRILAVGISYDRKTKEHHCKVEVL